MQEKKTAFQVLPALSNYNIIGKNCFFKKYQFFRSELMIYSVEKYAKRGFVLGNSWQARDKRILDYLEQLHSFENSDAILTIERILDKIVASNHFTNVKKREHCSNTYTFLKQFDTRTTERQQSDTGKRATKINAALSTYTAELYYAFDELGMIKNNTTHWDHYDYILIAGGGNDANRTRTLKAKEISDHLNQRFTPAKMIAAISTYRKIDENEKKITTHYALKLDYEFDILSKCIETIFFAQHDTSVSRIICMEDIQDQPTLSSKIIEFTPKYGGSCVRAYCAPKHNLLQTRADTRDCLKFFFDNTDIPQGSNVLLVTNNMFCTSQFTPDIAIDYQINLDIVGNSPDELCPKPDSIRCSSFINELIKTYEQFRFFQSIYMPHLK